jgi:hypothetical protein
LLEHVGLNHCGDEFLVLVLDDEALEGFFAELNGLQVVHVD